MNIVTNIKRRDYKNAIQFAIKGMHFDWYLNRKFMLDAYGKYFWYMELNRVSHIYAAYSDDNKLTEYCLLKFMENQSGTIHGLSNFTCVWLI